MPAMDCGLAPAGNEAAASAELRGRLTSRGRPWWRPVHMHVGRRILAAVAAAGFATGCGAQAHEIGEGDASAASPSASTSDPVLTTVPADAFAARSLTLKAAPGPAPVTQAAAESTAMALVGASRVLETVLAEVVKPGLDRLCWVVSLPPQYAPAAHPPMDLKAGSVAPSMDPPTYYVVFIDAATGTPIFSSSGSP